MALSTRRLSRAYHRFQPLVLDTFSRAVGSGLGQADTGQLWQVMSGAWSVESGHASLVSGASSGGRVVIESGQVNTCASVDFISPGAGMWTSLLVGFVDADNHYRIQQNEGTGTYDMYKKVGGTESYLGWARAGGPDTVECCTQQVSGGMRLRLYYGPTLMWEHTVPVRRRVRK